MKELTLTKESSTQEIKEYFSAVLELSQSDNEFPVNLNDVWPLVYTRRDNAIRELIQNFIQDVDYKVLLKNEENPNGGRPSNEYRISVSCLEYFIARKVRPVFEVYRQVFHKSVRSAKIPQSFSEALQLAADQARKIEEQQGAIADNERQIVALSNEITTMKPKAGYYDAILNSTSTVKTTQIAQDYGMSAKAFNILLRNLRVQHKVGGQWILYADHIAQGYVHGKPFNIKHSDGRSEVVYNTEWTQKGRIFLYHKLREHGILPLIEQRCA